MTNLQLFPEMKAVPVEPELVPVVYRYHTGFASTVMLKPEDADVVKAQWSSPEAELIAGFVPLPFACTEGDPVFVMAMIPKALLSGVSATKAAPPPILLA